MKEFKVIEQVCNQVVPQIKETACIDIKGNLYFNIGNKKCYRFVKDEETKQISISISDEEDLTLLPIPLYTKYTQVDEILKNDIIFIDNIPCIVINVYKGGTLLLINNTGVVFKYTIPYDMSANSRTVEQLYKDIVFEIRTILRILSVQKSLEIKSYLRGENVPALNNRMALLNNTKLAALSNTIPFSLWFRDRAYKAIILGIFITNKG